MRKTLITLGLIAATFLAYAGDAQAQRFGRGLLGGGRVGVGSYLGTGFGSGYYGPGYLGSGLGIGIGNGYSNQGYWGNGYYGSSYGNHYYSPYYGNNWNNGYNSTPYYYSSPGYSYATPNYSSAPPSYQSFYSGPSQQDALVTIFVPDPNAEVWFDNTPTTQRGTQRVFQTPALQQAGTYTIRARWTQNGQTMDQSRRIHVQPGQSAMVDFRGPNPQSVTPSQP